jgi:glutathione S-transferase
MPDHLVLHEYAASGNCYKVRLTAACVGEHLERREYDIMKGETRTPQFLWDVNSNGRIPVLQIDHRFIPESNAACYYIADGLWSKLSRGSSGYTSAVPSPARSNR